MSFISLTERIARHYVLYGRKARQKLVQKVAEAARTVAGRWPGTYEVQLAGPNDDGYVRLLRTPEDLKPRGRTVSYQALAVPVSNPSSDPAPRPDGMTDASR